MTEDPLRKALEHWPLSHIGAIERTATGTMNDTFVVHTTDRPVVLRRHRFTDPAVIEHEHALIEHALIQHARAGGVPAPAAIPTSGDAPFVCVDDRLYSLFEYASGHQVERVPI